MDYYGILEVDKNSSNEDIKSAYRRLAKKYHPDVNPNDPTAEEKFKEISEAYEILSDPEKKTNYDNFGNPNGQQDFGGFGGFGDFDVNSIFEQFLGRGHRQQQQNSDINMEINLSAKEFFSGCNKKIKLNREICCNQCNGAGGKNPKKCQICNGRGIIEQLQQNGPFTVVHHSPCSNCKQKGTVCEDPCHSCGSSGKISAEDLVDLHIPANAPLYATVQVANKGNHVIPNIMPGVLNVRLNLIQEDNWVVEQNGTMNCVVDVALNDWINNKQLSIDRFGVETFKYNLSELKTSTDHVIYEQKGLKSINGLSQGNLVATFRIIK